MAKKNPNIMTIGFDKSDPRHVQVTDLLNGMKHKKAQYIVEAVLAYENMRVGGSVPAAATGMEYEQIRNIVLKILAEQRSNERETTEPFLEKQQVQKSELPEETEIEMDIDEDAFAGIMQSLEAFRK